MKTLPRITLLAALLALAPIGHAVAQEAHAVNDAELQEMVARRAKARDTARETLREFLAQPEVVRLARSIGLDVRRAESAIAALSDEEAAMLASQVPEFPLAGGAGTITVTTTAIIIGLLVLIVLILVL